MKDKIYHILVIDDDSGIRDLLSKFLIRNGFLVSSAANVEEAWVRLKEFKFNILVVDIMMPGENGVEFTKKYRRANQVPILMLTAKSNSEERIEGLQSGADDYLVKPFEPQELVLRIKNILQRIDSNRSDLIYFGKFSFDIHKNCLYKNGEQIYLTSSEAELLRYFCNNLNNLIPREDMAKFLGGINERSVDVQINRLRQKIENDVKQPLFLKAIRNKGYILCDQ